MDKKWGNNSELVANNCDFQNKLKQKTQTMRLLTIEFEHRVKYSYHTNTLIMSIIT